MHYIGPCDVCGQGLRGVRACPRGHLAVVCDECEAVWRTPADARSRFARSSDRSCPDCGAGLWEAGSHWADAEELADTGWEGAVLGEYDRSPAGWERPAAGTRPGQSEGRAGATEGRDPN